MSPNILAEITARQNDDTLTFTPDESNIWIRKNGEITGTAIVIYDERSARENSIGYFESVKSMRENGWKFFFGDLEINWGQAEKFFHLAISVYGTAHQQD